MCMVLWDGFNYVLFSFFFFNATATTEIYTLSLHDALPICLGTLCNHQGAAGNDAERCRQAIRRNSHQSLHKSCHSFASTVSWGARDRDPKIAGVAVYGRRPDSNEQAVTTDSRRPRSAVVPVPRQLVDGVPVFVEVAEY